MLKLASGALLFSACSYFGMQIKRVYRIKLEIFSGLYDYATALSQEISHLKTPVSEFTEFYIKGISGASAQLIEKFSAGLKNGYTCAVDVMNEIKSPYLNRKEEVVVAEFFFRLGRNGVDGELGHLTRYAEEFKRRRNKAADTLKKEGDMYYKLAVLLGVALMIIVV